jgi:hypothetical protein
MDALARGADVLPNGTIRMRKVTLDKAILDGLPVRIYGQDRDPSADSLAIATAAISTSSLDKSCAAIVENGGEKTTAGSSTLSRTTSHKGSISGKSIRSIRSAKALALAKSSDDTETTVSPVTAAAATATAPSPHLDEVTSDTCAVCLDEFEEGEEIRSLPCRHEFHCECIGKNVDARFLFVFFYFATLVFSEVDASFYGLIQSPPLISRSMVNTQELDLSIM